MIHTDTQAILDVFKDVQNPFTLLFLATLVGAIVRVLKTKRVGDLFDALPITKRIPKAALPWIALVAAGSIATLDARFNAKLPWSQAAMLGLVGAVLGGGTAIGGHETLGKLGALFLGGPPTGTTNLPKPPSSDSKPDGFSGRTLAQFTNAVVVLTLSLELSACGLFSRSDIKTAKDVVLSAADIACVAESPLVDEDAVAAACGIVKHPLFRELLRQLIGQREAGKKAGFAWGITQTGTSADAGAKDAAPTSTRVDAPSPASLDAGAPKDAASRD